MSFQYVRSVVNFIQDKCECSLHVCINYSIYHGQMICLDFWFTILRRPGKVVSVSAALFRGNGNQGGSADGTLWPNNTSEQQLRYSGYFNGAQELS